MLEGGTVFSFISHRAINDCCWEKSPDPQLAFLKVKWKKGDKRNPRKSTPHPSTPNDEKDRFFRYAISSINPTYYCHCNMPANPLIRYWKKRKKENVHASIEQRKTNIRDGDEIKDTKRVKYTKDREPKGKLGKLKY